MEIILSGGNFGGEIVALAAEQTIIEVIDVDGVAWIYEVRGEQAIFTGTK